MNLDALPYTSFIVLVEFSVGSLLVCLLAQARGRVAESFLKFCAGMIAVGALVTLLNVLVLDPRSVIGGYRLDQHLFDWVKIGAIVFLLTTLPYNWALMRGDKEMSMVTGAVAGIAGVAWLAVVAYYVSLPTWGYAGALLSIAAGTIAVGAVVEAMTLGHWYLMTPRLPREPLSELTLLLVGAIALQAVLLVVNVIVPAREVPAATAFLGSTSLGANPAFWLRIALGLAFPAALAYMSFVSSKGYPANENAMMSATGLLYIAVGAVIVGEVLARGLMFLTGVPV
ncbi:MAG TPA: hypothetical protein VEZ14_14245 [Dehalococcoidia bacterium]|nr:hypothetical protein [Dehalococcoidia bacterium]